MLTTSRRTVSPRRLGLRLNFYPTRLTCFDGRRRIAGRYFVAANARGFDRVALAGVSELAEIATICALETGIEIVVIVDAHSSLTTFAGLPVVASYDGIEDGVRAIVVTELKTARETYAAAVQRFGAEHVLVPSMLGVETENTGEIPT